MNNSKKYLFLIVMILIVVIGVSLAYFGITIIGNDAAKGNKVVTGNLELTFNDSNELTLDGAFPGDYITKTISIKNTGTKEVSYNLVWTELTNEIINSELVIEASCKNLNSSNTEEGTCNSILQKAVSSASNITSNIPIKPGYTQEYTIKITFIDTGKPQNYNKNKTFEGKLGITESSAKTVYCTFDGELTQGAEYVNGQYTYRYMQERDGITWNNITSDGWGVIFTDKTKTGEISENFCTYINDKPTISMSWMFADTQATTLNLSSFNTSNVTNMVAMLSGTQATLMDLSSFNTSKVTNMASIFEESIISELDISSFNFASIQNINNMFYRNSNITTIYATNNIYIPDNVTSSNMFKYCTNLLGGAGTTYSSGKVSGAYAHIDGGTDNPGYFTDIKDKPKEPESFATDSWSTIAKAVRDNNISKYNVGDTKTVDMGTYGTHTVRIANTSIPSECSTDGFSQSACGFVLEFADIITNHVINESGLNIGGWPASEMYTFVNTDIYNALPSELRNVIIDTTTVSGYGSEDTENFTSTDKLYLLSTAEVWAQGNADNITTDTARNNTRQFDYYKNLNTDTVNYSPAIKNNGSSAAIWWLRSATSNGNDAFYRVHKSGGWVYISGDSARGVSPAFRIG